MIWSSPPKHNALSALKAASWCLTKKRTPMPEQFIAEKRPLNLGWLFDMAWRDSRKNRSRLLLFISSIIFGIAALVAIYSFGFNLKKDVDTQAATLIGADLTISSN